MLLPSRSTLVGGLGGLAAWGLSLLLSYCGISVPQEAQDGAILLVTTLLVHFVPDSLKSQADALNVDVKSLAAWLPVSQFPDQDKKSQ
jgi:hypothetical protein